MNPNIYEITIRGAWRTLIIQVIANSFWGAWEQYDHIYTSLDYPTNIGRTLELNLKFISPLYI